MAVIIDNFEVGPFSLTDSNNNFASATLSQTLLSPSDVLGGTRDILFEHSGGGPTNFETASLVLTPGDDGVAISPIPDRVPPLFAQLFIDYTFAAGSLTGDRFRLIVSAASTTAAFLNDARVTLSDGTTSQNGAVFISAPGTFEIPFSVYTLNIADVNFVTLRLGTPSSITVSHFDTIPEPGTLPLLCLGLAALALRRRALAG